MRGTGRPRFHIAQILSYRAIECYFAAIGPPPADRRETDMNSPNSLDPSTILDRIIGAVTRNLRIEEILLQLGLDPSNITFDAVFNRLIDVGLTHITLANMLALTGAVFFVATLMVRTIVPLRIIGIISN